MRWSGVDTWRTFTRVEVDTKKLITKLRDGTAAGFPPSRCVLYLAGQLKEFEETVFTLYGHLREGKVVKCNLLTIREVGEVGFGQVRYIPMRSS